MKFVTMDEVCHNARCLTCPKIWQGRGAGKKAIKHALRVKHKVEMIVTLRVRE